MRKLILPALFLFACQPEYTGSSTDTPTPSSGFSPCLAGTWTLSAVGFPSTGTDIPWSTAELTVTGDELIIVGLCPDDSGSATLYSAATGSAEAHCKTTLPNGEEGRWDTTDTHRYISVRLDGPALYIAAGGDIGVGQYTLPRYGIQLRGTLVTGGCRP